MNKTTESFNHAIDGIITSLKTERNMRFHFALALCVLIGALFLNVSKVELLLLMISITLVIFAELMNTAVEYALDKDTTFHPKTKRAKDISAGAVLITALNAVVEGYIIFWDKLQNISLETIKIVKNSNTYVFFITIIIIAIMVIIIKAITTNGTICDVEGRKKHGTYLKGGMPSGHTTLGFAVATIISLITENSMVIVLSFSLAFLVAQSRVDSKIHKVSETVAGAILGIISVVAIFKLFYL